MGYYYETAITGVPEVDEISNAVECAGNWYQHTQQWTERDANGRCVVDNIDDALRACADTITTLREQLAAAQRQRLREERILATLEGWSPDDVDRQYDALYALCGDSDDSTIRCAVANLHNANRIIRAALVAAEQEVECE